jgi:hypothetical protein
MKIKIYWDNGDYTSIGSLSENTKFIKRLLSNKIYNDIYYFIDGKIKISINFRKVRSIEISEDDK